MPENTPDIAATKLYQVTAYRWGEAHPTPHGGPYEVGICSTLERAIALAEQEYEDRGSCKYEIAVYEVELDAEYDPKLVHYVGKGEGPRVDRRFQFYLRVGFEYGDKIISGEIPLPPRGKDGGISRIECSGLMACYMDGKSIGPAFDKAFAELQKTREATNV